MSSNRSKLARNSFASLVYQVVLVISGLILPRFIMEYYGSLTYGLVSSISQFLGLITLCELGIGAVIQASLYRPLVDGNKQSISKVFVSSQKFFNKITLIIVAYIVILIFTYPLIVDDSFDFLLTAGLILSISVTYIFQYLFGITNQLLLDADQEVSVEVLPQIFATIVATLVSIVLMKCGCGIVQVKAASALVYIARPIYLSWYVRRHYQIDRTIKYTEEPIKQKWNGIAQHVANVVLRNTSTIALTLFANLQFVAIYAVYSMVIKAFSQAIESTTISLTSFLGIKIAESNVDDSNKTFDYVEFFFHNIMSLLFVLIGILIVPFVKVYTAGIEDADYIQPIFAVFMVLGYYVYNLRTPYHVIIKAAGHFKQTQQSAMIEALINIVITLALIKISPLLAVTIGFLCAMIYRTIYYIWYLKRNILYRDVRIFFKYLFTDVILIVFIIALSFLFSSKTIDSYWTWIIYSLKITLTAIFVDVLFCVLFYKTYAKMVMSLLQNRVLNK